MSKYADLPFIENLSFPRVDYHRAQALRGPIAAAINPARSADPKQMEDIITILEAALRHIRGGQMEEKNEETVLDDLSSGDVLDSLLGSSAKAGGDAG